MRKINLLQILLPADEVEAEAPYRKTLALLATSPLPTTTKLAEPPLM
ncbi:MAG: hypothetical protein LBG59_08320 [Candidatus Peribacteria bacterium]|nr:hypothetical protein [Candidatus Peribacteria bacterium]